MYQVMPPLTADEYADLEQSIKANGVQVPITVDADGNIVDGHHRDEIARRLDKHCPRVVAEGDETTLRSLAFSLNLHRRHLSREQKRALVEASLKADPQLSDREHARRTGVSPTTAGDVRADLEDDGQLSSLDSRMGADGKSRPASKPATHDCVTCGASFTKPQWHCAGCGAHYEVGKVRTCPTCNPVTEPVDVTTGEVLPEPKPSTAPRKGNRKPLPDQARTAGWELQKAVDRVQRVLDDDRLAANKEAVAPHLRSHLSNAVEVCQDLLARIND